jgi:hypothetical protein
MMVRVRTFQCLLSQRNETDIKDSVKCVVHFSKCNLPDSAVLKKDLNYLVPYPQSNLEVTSAVECIVSKLTPAKDIDFGWKIRSTLDK